MAGTTPLYGFPFGELTDSPTDLLSVPDLALAVETQLATSLLPAGDSSNTQYLSGHVAANAGDRKVALTVTFSLSKSQYILVGANARVDNQSGGSGGDGAMSIVVDSTYDHTMNSGPFTFAAAGSIGERLQFVIPTTMVGPLAAGSHTVELQYDQDSTSGTKWVMGGAISHNSRNFYPTRLIVVV